ncbi:trans-aconitate 2-methyltransferase [Sorangium sp. So ce176]
MFTKARRARAGRREPADDVAKPAAHVDDAEGARGAGSAQRVEERGEHGADALALAELLGQALELGVHAEQERVDGGLIEEIVARRGPRRDAGDAGAAGGAEALDDVAPAHGQAREGVGIVGDEEIGDLRSIHRREDAGGAPGSPARLGVVWTALGRNQGLGMWRSAETCEVGGGSRAAMLAGGESAMADWDPAQYLMFEDQRARPAVDLLGRVALGVPGEIVDLGCGAGNITRLVAQRFPERAIVGVDSSPEMLARARAALPGARFVEADIARFAPAAPPALIFSNAALHWLDDHPALFPALLGRLAKGGVLAVQMPRNHGAPSHTAMVEASRVPRFRGKLAAVVRESPVAEPRVYYEVLAPHAAQIEIWETEYLHVLEGESPVVEWTKGTALRPLLAALDDGERADFLEEYGRRVAAAYPKAGDGKTPFPFRRLFLVARAR